MNLTLDKADIVSVKIEEIVVKHKSIQEEIRNGEKHYPLIFIDKLPKDFEGFMWRLSGKTMIAIRGENLSFQIVIMRGNVPRYMTNMQAIRRYTRNANNQFKIRRTDESIRLTKTINNTEAKITLDAKVIA